MAELVVVVPSRGRPSQAWAVAAAFDATCTADTKLIVAVDDDDPTVGEYPSTATVLRSRSMNEALNLVAVDAAEDAYAVGFMGDDHLPRTKGWDTAYLAALHRLGSGIVYGNDLAQGRNLPTQCAMTSDIVRALGYFAPPVLTHLYLDNFWRSLGNEAGCIRYLPEVIVEHRHPLLGKSSWDAGYERVNSPDMQGRDLTAWAAYLESQFDEDVAKVRELRGDAFIKRYARPELVCE